MQLFEDLVSAPSLGCGERDLPLLMGSQRLGRLVGQVVLGLAPSMLKQRLHLKFEELRRLGAVGIVVDYILWGGQDKVPADVSETIHGIGHEIMLRTS